MYLVCDSVFIHDVRSILAFPEDSIVPLAFWINQGLCQ